MTGSHWHRGVVPVVLPRLAPEIASLIRDGRWSLLSTDLGIVVETDGGNHCCNPNPKRRWLLDTDGQVLREIDALPTGKIAFVRLP